MVRTWVVHMHSSLDENGFPARKKALSPARRQLVGLMQRVNFGRIEGLILRGGEPVFDGTPPRVVLEVKLASENGPRPEYAMADFALKAEVVDLFEHFDRLRDVQIEMLIVKHGLPFMMQVEIAI